MLCRYKKEIGRTFGVFRKVVSGSPFYEWFFISQNSPDFFEFLQEGNFGWRRFFSHLILEEGVASKRALRSISFIFIIILKIHLTNTFEKSSHIYANSTRRLYMSNTMTEDNTLNVLLLCNIRWNYLIPNYFLCFFADFFFSSRTSFWTRFNIGCAHIVRSIMPFAGWATRFLTFGFLGVIFFWCWEK